MMPRGVDTLSQYRVHVSVSVHIMRMVACRVRVYQIFALFSCSWEKLSPNVLDECLI